MFPAMSQGQNCFQSSSSTIAFCHTHLLMSVAGGFPETHDTSITTELMPKQIGEFSCFLLSQTLETKMLNLYNSSHYFL